MAAGFFYSKTFKIIATVIISVELIIIITLKVVDLYCDEPGRNSTSNSYSSKSQRSYSSGKKSKYIHTVILIHPEETILMMFIIMMIRMISPMTGLRNSMEEIMMADMMMRMITGRRTTGINNTRKLWS